MLITYNEKCERCNGLNQKTVIKEGIGRKFCFSCGRTICFKIEDRENMTNNSETSLLEGFGLKFVMFKDGTHKKTYQLHSIPEYKWDEKIVNFKCQLSSQKKEVDKNLSYLSVWDEEKEQIVVLYGQIDPDIVKKCSHII